MKRSLLFAILPLMLLATGCVHKPTAADFVGVKRIQIVNNLDKMPKYMVIGTTIFNNELHEANLPTIKDFTTDYLTKRLTRRGYQVVKKSQSADLILTIKPGSIYDLSQSEGYGYYERSLFGISGFSASYAALFLIPNKNGNDICIWCKGESFTELPINNMPDTWEELADFHKKKFADQLIKDLTTAMDEALKKTSL